MNVRTSSILIIILLSSAAHSADESDYMKFVEKAQALGRNFDKAGVELYSDDAKVTAIRKMADGSEQIMRAEGKEWKQLLLHSLDIAKQRGDRSEYSDIKISVEKNRAKVTAIRYATIKCFYDKNYYMIVEEQSNGELKIVEEFMESPAQSNCSTPPDKNDLSLVLQATVKAMNNQLPIMVDSDIKLEKISSEGDRLTHHYVFANYLSSELDATVLEQNLLPVLIQRACTIPNLKPILDQGGSMSFIYKGRDQKQLLEINVDKNSCL